MKKSIMWRLSGLCLGLCGFLNAAHGAEAVQFQTAPTAKVPIERLVLQPEDELELAEDETPVEAVPLEEIQYFVKIYQIAKDNFVNSVEDRQLFEQAIRGLIGGLDAYSRYLTPEQYKQLLQYSEGELATADLHLNYQERRGIWQLQGIEPNSALAQLGLANGQTLLKIDEVPVKGLSQDDIGQLLKGVQGSTVSLQVSEQVKPVLATRTKKLNSDIQHQLLPKATVLLKVSVFQQSTANEIKQLIEFYQTEHKIKTVLLDIRHNPGGLLSAAIETADLFLDQGLIVSTKGRTEPEQQFQALPGNEFAELNVGILQNRKSASAAEVLTAALKDHQRAIVLGEQSYGKGAVQKLFALNNGAALQMTVSHYYTPKNQMIEGKGIQPHVLLNAPETMKDEQYLQYVNEVLHQQLARKRPS